MAPITENDINKNIITKEIDTIWSWTENITEINLSNKGLSEFNESVTLPLYLMYLNLSHNLFEFVPDCVLNLKKLMHLDLSYNNILYFDDTPNFCHTIVNLYLNNNKLHGLPFWVWYEQPKKILYLDISSNENLLDSLSGDYREQFSKCITSAEEINISNCCIRLNNEIFSTFCKTKKLIIGDHNYSARLVNNLEDFPSKGLLKCCDMERLFLCNISIYNITKDINVFKFLKEIDLSMNYISGLPSEFCDLISLESCVLSHNRLLYLPDAFCNLKNLRNLHVDNNFLCLLPDNLFHLSSLVYLDAYNNNIDNKPEEYGNLERLDFAQNYFEEPEDAEYLEKKENLRMRLHDQNRVDGR